MYIDQTRYITTPDAAGRLEKEMAVYRLLEQLQMPFIRVDHDAANTIEDCAAVDEGRSLLCHGGSKRGQYRKYRTGYDQYRYGTEQQYVYSEL